MKFITKEEYEKLTPIVGGHAKKSNFRELCRRMDIGKLLFVTRREWKTFGYREKSSPTMNCPTDKKNKLTFRTRAFAEGWVTERTR